MIAKSTIEISDELFYFDLLFTIKKLEYIFYITYFVGIFNC